MHTWKTLPFCHHLRLGYINKLLLSGFLPKVSMTAAKLLYRLGTVALILYDSKVILKILQARLQHYVNWELPDVQTGFRKGRGTRDQIANIQLIGKDPNTGKNEVRKRGTTEDQMVGWHHWLNRHKFEQAPGDGDGQESLVCYSQWGHRESDMIEGLNSLIPVLRVLFFFHYF